MNTCNTENYRYMRMSRKSPDFTEELVDRHLQMVESYHQGTTVRGENIMLQNQGIMLCFDANIISLLCSTKQIIMLHK